VLNLISCDTPLDAVGDLAPNEEIAIVCSTEFLLEETWYEAVAVGTASDNTTEPSGVSTAVVKILSPSTAIGLNEHSTVVLRLVVQTLTVTETNDGDSPLTDVHVTVSPTGLVLYRDSKEYVAGDMNNDGILDPGETWEWRVVTVALVGDAVTMPASSQSMELTAIGYGVDQLGGEVTIPGDMDEIGTIEVPISTN